MKHIQKAGCPHSYARWRASVAGTIKSDWREVPAPEKRRLLVALIEEQGALCAYTMRRIDNGSSHVEHIKPQSRCRADQAGSDLDYNNLVACFPREGMQTTCRYGAQEKGSWWENDGATFVSPLHPACERRFRFGRDGKIAAVGKHAAAVKTIGVLALTHKSLTEDRKRAIEEFIYGPKGDHPLSIGNSQRARRIICNRDGRGRFYEFCIAIRDALQEHVTALRRRSQRRRAGRGAS
jgi:uncharacterized protein (TIGR02646 family)